MALFFPYLAPERVLRRRLGRSWRLLSQTSETARPPLVISHRESNAQRIAALDEQAEGLGLKRGMGLADARAMHPRIDVVEADPHADMRLLESLADWCDRYTPLVAIDGSDALFLDITGCSHLFGGERAMLDDVLGRLFHQGFDVRAGLGSTPGAAWAAARFHSGLIVVPGEEAALLEPLPLQALRLEAGLRAGLESVGLGTAGAVMAAPRAPLVRRFGRIVIDRLDQALGRSEEAISPRLPVAPVSVERRLAEPVCLVEDIENLIGLLAGTLSAELARRGQGARALELRLFRVDGVTHRLAVGTSRALRDPVLIRRLFHERLEAEGDGIDAGYGFDLVRLSAQSLADMPDEQVDLCGDTVQDERDVGLLADRIRARLGHEAILQPALAPSHVPERAVVFVPFDPDLADVKRGQLAAPPPLERPFRLLPRPEPIDVTAEIPEGAPLNFRWRRALYHVARSEGPERIAPEWWRMPPDPRPEAEEQESSPSPGEALTRDYFRIEDLSGHRYWLFRQGFYGRASHPPRWFLHGVFA